MFTSLISEQNPTDPNEIGVSSLMDAWLLLRNLESNGERNRGLYVLKARGMAHSNQVREFVLTDRGVQLLDVYLGPAGMLTGSARLAQVAKEAAEACERRHELENKSFELQQKRQQMEMQIRQIRANFEMDERRLRQDISGMEGREKQMELSRLEMADSRGLPTPVMHGNGSR
jgi:circadian clock protein KaiC